MEVILCDLKHVLNRLEEAREQILVHNFDQLRFPIAMDANEEIQEVVAKIEREIAIIEGAIKAIVGE